MHAKKLIPYLLFDYSCRFKWHVVVICGYVKGKLFLSASGLYVGHTVCKKSIRVLEIFRVQKLILNATS